MRQNGVRSNVRFPTGASGMKKGGSAKKKKQGYKDRKEIEELKGPIEVTEDEEGATIDFDPG